MPVDIPARLRLINFNLYPVIDPLFFYDFFFGKPIVQQLLLFDSSQ